MRRTLPVLLLVVIVAVVAYLFGAGVVSVSVDRERLREKADPAVDATTGAANQLADEARSAGRVIAKETDEAAGEIREGISGNAADSDEQ